MYDVKLGEIYESSQEELIQRAIDLSSSFTVRKTLAIDESTLWRYKNNKQEMKFPRAARLFDLVTRLEAIADFRKIFSDIRFDDDAEFKFETHINPLVQEWQLFISDCCDRGFEYLPFQPDPALKVIKSYRDFCLRPIELNQPPPTPR